jgi:hypothetical protein
MKVNFKNIPQELKDRPHWVLWYLVTKNNREIKLPLQAKAGRVTASTTDPKTWTNYEQAMATLKRRPRDFSGIGIVLTGENDLVGIDLDDCVDPISGKLLPAAMEIVKRLDSYAEISPSGTGVKIFTLGGNRLKLPRNKGTLNEVTVEIYCVGRYFAVTGNLVTNAPQELHDRHDLVLAMSQRLASVSGAKPSSQRSPRSPRLENLPQQNEALARVLKKLRNVRESSNGFTASCPAHRDTNPSLSVGVGADDRVLLHCFRDCKFLDIVRALKLEPRDLYPVQNLVPRHRKGGLS